MDEKISVIIPIYKVEEYLDQCISSVVNQTYENLEIILVDDGSPDNCPYMCDKWMEKDERIRVIHKQNGGLSDARNAGMKVATGKYISFVDSDDWIENRFIEYLYKVLVEQDCDFSGCKIRKCESYENNIHNKEVFKSKEYDTVRGLSALIDDIEVHQVVWNKLYKRKLIADIFFEKGKQHEDEFWSYQVFARSKKYVEIDYFGYNYFQRETSIMGKKYSIKRLDAVEAKIRRQFFLEKYFPELASQGKVNLLFTCIAHGQAAITSLDVAEKKYMLVYLKRIVKENKMGVEEYKTLKFTHIVWLLLAKYAFEFTCQVRQRLQIGY